MKTLPLDVDAMLLLSILSGNPTNSPQPWPSLSISIPFRLSWSCTMSQRHRESTSLLKQSGALDELLTLNLDVISGWRMLYSYVYVSLASSPSPHSERPRPTKALLRSLVLIFEGQTELVMQETGYSATCPRSHHPLASANTNYTSVIRKASWS